jgi:3-isopropylmalate/(R)-2-methylmalate dehydratase large subunit
MDDRLCVCNMAIEAGGKNGIFPVDETTLEYLKEHGAKEPAVYAADPDAKYVREIEVDLSTLTPLVAFPHLPENVQEAGRVRRSGHRPGGRWLCHSSRQGVASSPRRRS